MSHLSVSDDESSFELINSFADPHANVLEGVHRLLQLAREAKNSKRETEDVNSSGASSPPNSSKDLMDSDDGKDQDLSDKNVKEDQDPKEDPTILQEDLEAQECLEVTKFIEKISGVWELLSGSNVGGFFNFKVLNSNRIEVNCYRNDGTLGCQKSINLTSKHLALQNRTGRVDYIDEDQWVTVIDGKKIIVKDFENGYLRSFDFNGKEDPDVLRMKKVEQFTYSGKNLVVFGSQKDQDSKVEDSKEDAESTPEILAEVWEMLQPMTKHGQMVFDDIALYEYPTTSKDLSGGWQDPVHLKARLPGLWHLIQSLLGPDFDQLKGAAYWEIIEKAKTMEAGIFEAAKNELEYDRMIWERMQRNQKDRRDQIPKDVRVKAAAKLVNTMLKDDSPSYQKNPLFLKSFELARDLEQELCMKARNLEEYQRKVQEEVENIEASVPPQLSVEALLTPILVKEPSKETTKNAEHSESWRDRFPENHQRETTEMLMKVMLANKENGDLNDSQVLKDARVAECYIWAAARSLEDYQRLVREKVKDIEGSAPPRPSQEILEEKVQKAIVVSLLLDLDSTMKAIISDKETPLNKAWHSECPQDLRNNLIEKIANATHPEPFLKEQDSLKKVIVQEARNFEQDFYSKANDKEEYYRLITEKIYTIQQKAAEDRKKKLREQESWDQVIVLDSQALKKREDQKLKQEMEAKKQNDQKTSESLPILQELNGTWRMVSSGDPSDSDSIGEYLKITTTPTCIELSQYDANGEFYEHHTFPLHTKGSPVVLTERLDYIEENAWKVFMNNEELFSTVIRIKEGKLVVEHIRELEEGPNYENVFERVEKKLEPKELKEEKDQKVQNFNGIWKLIAVDDPQRPEVSQELGGYLEIQADSLNLNIETTEYFKSGALYNRLDFLIRSKGSKLPEGEFSLDYIENGKWVTARKSGESTTRSIEDGKLRIESNFLNYGSITKVYEKVEKVVNEAPKPTPITQEISGTWKQVSTTKDSVLFKTLGIQRFMKIKATPSTINFSQYLGTLQLSSRTALLNNSTLCYDEGHLIKDSITSNKWICHWEKYKGYTSEKSIENGKLVVKVRSDEESFTCVYERTHHFVDEIERNAATFKVFLIGVGVTLFVLFIISFC